MTVKRLIGSNPSQVPRNKDLGSFSFQDADNVNISGGAITASSLTAVNLQNNTSVSSVSPTLQLDFVNNNTLDPRITFTRASTATYYDSKTTVLAEQNLLKYSQDISNSNWNKVNAGSTIVSNSIIAPDGTQTASMVTAVAGNVRHDIYQWPPSLSANIPYTFSIYLKQGSSQYVAVQIGSGQLSSTSWVCAVVNLSNGTLTQSTSGGNTSFQSYNITSVGNGWYRISVSITTTVNDLVCGFSIFNSGTPVLGGWGIWGTTWAATGSETIYAWGAQLEQRSSVTSYSSTTTSTINNFIPTLMTSQIDSPRFDYDPITGECRGLLIEETRSNYCLYSANAANSNWQAQYSGTGTLPIVIANDSVAPDGSQSAALVSLSVTSASSSSDYSGIFQQVLSGVTNGVVHTFSFWIKAAFASDVGKTILFRGVTQNTYQSVTLTSSWQRVFTTENAASSIVSITHRPSYSSTIGTINFHVWGMQLEAGYFPTSYIPTSSASVSRAQDIASITGSNFSSWFRQDEGTIFTDYQLGYKLASMRVISFNDMSSTNYFEVIASGYIPPTVGIGPYVYGRVNNVATINDSTGALTNIAFDRRKFACGYKVNNFIGYNNGSLSGSVSNTNVPVVSQLYFGNFQNSSSTALCGWVRQITFYPKCFSNSELQEMSSL